MSQSTLLILTVGTGTAGPESFIAEGLRRTIEKTDPRLYWLIPSRSPESLEVADFIREGFPKTFAAWSETEPYAIIDHHDRFDNCREAVRQVIHHVRSQRIDDERLIVNPTSGTKQMSAGATIAALDEGVGELSFTVGERVDGVVRTGTERLETFDASRYFAERTFTEASELFKLGAFNAASNLLGNYHQFSPQTAFCRCLHEWERLNYAEALRRSRLENSQTPEHKLLLSTLRRLVKDSTQPWPSPAIVSDLLRSAQHKQLHGNPEGALVRATKALEMGLRLDFYRRTNLFEPYPVQKILRIPNLPSKIQDDLRKTERHRTLIGLRQLIELLHVMKSRLAEAYLAKDSPARQAYDIRNRLTHQIRAVSPQESRQAIRSITDLLAPLGIPKSKTFPKELARDSTTNQ